MFSRASHKPYVLLNILVYLRHHPISGMSHPLTRQYPRPSRQSPLHRGPVRQTLFRFWPLPTNPST